MRINWTIFCLITILNAIAIVPVNAEQNTGIKAVVNGNADTIAPDDQLTLREAIALINGDLKRDRLSESERAQISEIKGLSEITFNLPKDKTVIRVSEELPAIAAPVIIDGATQPDYEPSKFAIVELPLAKPIVEITTAEGKFVPRGFTISADNVTIRSLSIYGFNNDQDDTLRTPAADIFIGHRFSPPNTQKHPTPANFSPFYKNDVPPKNVVIEDNWLGIRPDQSVPKTTSAFGVSVFNSTGTIIRRNWIANHDGSGIITSVNAQNLEVLGNAIVSNGIAGMPDGIRLEGDITESIITENLICGNDGAGVYLFKPQGSTQIRKNRITFNGRRYRRAAVYLMGNDHQVNGNYIANQTGAGVVVASYPRSQRNAIESNGFANLEGLSIDLVTQDNTGVQDYQRGDGMNPQRNSENRRKDTGNGSVNAPVLTKFETTRNQFRVTGKADPNTQIQIYRVTETQSDYAILGEPIAVTSTNAKGEFEIEISNLKSGEGISAIATDPNYGTSEAAIPSILGAPTTPAPSNTTPQCVTPTPVEPVPTAQPTEEPPKQIVLKVPKNVHFALDRSEISSTSAKVLDRIVTVLRENPTITVDIQGHTDPRASDAYNLELGRRRAIAVRNYLTRQGIDSARLTIRSFGEQQRRSQGNSRLDFARDRRVELQYKDARNIEVIVQEDDLQLESETGVRE